MKFRFVFLVMLALFNFANVFSVDKKPCTGPVLFISGGRLYSALVEQADIISKRTATTEDVNLLWKRLREKVGAVAADIAKRRGACAVLEGHQAGISSGCLYHNPDNDITDEMIEILNSSYLLDRNKNK